MLSGVRTERLRLKCLERNLTEAGINLDNLRNDQGTISYSMQYEGDVGTYTLLQFQLLKPYVYLIFERV
ncbi:hypothetical protein CKF58_06330 [Psittacicella hinzii]|uniref:Uncharacterized protein n=2 Tax=Psittacicella hinzii TaxID=2028575 RepID=A0A3A1YFE0_9GAMM|nr:hypothetical protein CKF58_06330 [Psittacicella hinzii]